MEKKQFFKALFMLGVPIALQNLIVNGLNFLDTIMIGRLGGLEIAAVGLANQIFFIFSVVMFGVCSGTAVFTAQFWGDKNLDGFNKATAAGLLFSVVPTLVMFGLAFFFPEMVMGLFTQDQELIALSSRYLKVASFSYLFAAGAFLYEQVMKSSEQVRFPLYVSMVAFGVNTILNYLLIFGHFGFPAMGVEGAALATVISRMVEFSLVIGLIFLRNMPGAIHAKSFQHIDQKYLKNFMYVVGPVILNEISWVLGISMYMAVYGRMSAQAVTVVSITITVERLLQVLYFGLGGASSIMIGNILGTRDKEMAQRYGARLLRVSFWGGMLLGLLMILLAPIVVMPFNIDSETTLMTIRTIRVMGLAVGIRSYNITMITGVLRAGGDTRYCLMLDTVGVWLVALPLGYLAGLVWGLPVYWVYFIFIAEDFFKIVVGTLRFRSKKWINVLT